MDIVHVSCCLLHWVSRTRAFELTDPNNLLINALLEYVKGPDLQIQSYIISKKQENRAQ